MVDNTLALRGANPPVNALGAFQQGATTATNIQGAKLQQAAATMEMIGSGAMYAMGGNINGEVDPAKYNEVMDSFESMGVNVSQFRNNPNFAKVAAQASVSALDRLKLARSDRDYELALQKFEMDLMQAAQPKPPKVETIYDDETGRDQKVIWDQEKGDFVPIGGQKAESSDTNNIRDYEFYAEQERAAGREPLAPLEWDIARRKAGSTNITNTVGGGETPGWKKIDEAFAETYIDWQSGGFTDTRKQLAQLSESLKILESGEPVTGAIGVVPDFAQPFINEQGTIAKDQVEEVVQRNLRVILGAQFTEEEGKRLIARAYNSKLPPAENAKRVRRLIEQIGGMAQAKQSMVDFFDQNGTLRGYQGPRPSKGDLDNIDFASDEGASDRTEKERARRQYFEAAGSPGKIEDIPLSDVQKINGEWYVKRDGKVFKVGQVE